MPHYSCSPLFLSCSPHTTCFSLTPKDSLSLAFRRLPASLHRFYLIPSAHHITSPSTLHTHDLSPLSLSYSSPPLLRTRKHIKGRYGRRPQGHGHSLGITTKHSDCLFICKQKRTDYFLTVRVRATFSTRETEEKGGGEGGE